jgi:hypothetical protein
MKVGYTYSTARIMVEGKQGNIESSGLRHESAGFVRSAPAGSQSRTCPTLLAILFLIPPAVFGATGLVLSDVTVGQNLEAQAMVAMNAAAPAGGLVISLTSNDPSRVLLSVTPDAAGSPSITLTVSSGFRVSPAFYVQGLANSGVITYTASAPGYDSATGKVTLTESGVVIAGPAKFGNPIRTTLGRISARTPTITVYSAQLDSSGNFVVAQPLRGGSSATVHIVISNPEVATIAASRLTIAAGSFSATTQFQSRGVGEATLSVDAAPGFKLPAQFTSVKATVSAPQLTVTEQVVIGANLEIPGAVLLGAEAPEGGTTVTLTSSDPSRLLLSASATVPGSKAIKVSVQAGATNGQFYLQALADSGTVTYTADGPGYGSHTGTIGLAPSGVLLAAQGPPDEAEVLHPEYTLRAHKLAASVAGGTTPIRVYTAYLNSKTHRGADITVQRLRAGMSLTVSLKNSNPAVGTAPDTVTIEGGSEQSITQFTPLAAGSTELSAVTPTGFTTSSNSMTLTAVVKP